MGRMTPFPRGQNGSFPQVLWQSQEKGALRVAHAEKKPRVQRLGFSRSYGPRAVPLAHVIEDQHQDFLE